MQERPIRVLIVDDHEIVREGLRTLLSEQPDIEVVGEAASGGVAAELAARLEPDVVLMDLVMPGLDGIEAIGRLRAVAPASQVLVLTSFSDDRRIRDAIQAGAIGYLLKDVLRSDLLRAIHAAARGEPTLHPEVQRQLMRQVSQPLPRSPLDDLTGRERDVLYLVARGASNKEIAAQLGLTEGTVKGYVSAILTKLELEDRTQAALFAVRHGLVSLE